MRTPHPVEHVPAEAVYIQHDPRRPVEVSFADLPAEAFDALAWVADEPSVSLGGRVRRPFDHTAPRARALATHGKE